jgi:hypothetical protein
VAVVRSESYKDFLLIKMPEDQPEHGIRTDRQHKRIPSTHVDLEPAQKDTGKTFETVEPTQDVSENGIAPNDHEEFRPSGEFPMIDDKAKQCHQQKT